MANERHVETLKTGSAVWNEWREEHPNLIPNLIGADLGSINLRRANLYLADLSGANLNEADLRRANLNKSTLNNTDMSGADLTGADLSGAELRRAKLISAVLTGANLGVAALVDTDLSGANLKGANLDGAHINRASAVGTVFADIDLRTVEGLESIRPVGTSLVSTSTIRLSHGEIPEVFLRNCGLEDWEVEATKLYRTDLNRSQVVELTYKILDLRLDPLLKFNSCFISYSSKDEIFARRLYSDLQNRGVRCWFAPEDMKTGDRIRNRIDDSILLHDKLLLILSSTSLVSQWIEQEVETALEKERDQGYDVLFPVRLDDAVMTLRRGWPALIVKTRHIGDFRHWENPFEYAKALERLLNDLRKDS